MENQERLRWESFTTGDIPNAGLKRQTFNLSTTYNVNNRLTIDARANYIIEKVKNRPIANDGPGNPEFRQLHAAFCIHRCREQ